MLFARAALEIAEAYFVTERDFEPNLNAITVRRAPPAVAVTSPLLSNLIQPASRRRLTPADAFSGHLDELLEISSTCGLRSLRPNAAICAATSALLLPSLEPAPDGALEQHAVQRVAGTPMRPFDLLTAAFEVAAWRPAGMHPMTAEAARHAAALTRIRSRDAGHPCDVSALWVAAALTGDIPDIRSVIDGLWQTDGRQVDLRAIALHAAQSGCRSANFVERPTPIASNRPSVNPASRSLAFWDVDSVLNISALAGSRIAGTLSAMTEGAAPAPAPQPVDPDAVAESTAAPTPYRSCDAVSQVVPFSVTESVRGIRVHHCLAESVRALLAAARNDGVRMSGWGWRSTVRQIQLRRQFCPLPSRWSSDYWRKLSLLDPAECTPPVSKPTTSQHEYGLAVDFNCGAAHITVTANSRCFSWLEANAHRYGLYNLPSEPWHWSISGR